jgi:hypothetical protein
MRVDYIVPQPRWQVHNDGTVLELNDEQVLKIVNAFLRNKLLGEVVEEWTAVGKTYLYVSQKEKNRKEQEK